MTSLASHESNAALLNEFFESFDSRAPHYDHVLQAGVSDEWHLKAPPSAIYCYKMITRQSLIRHAYILDVRKCL